MKKIIQGLTILSRYVSDENGPNIVEASKGVIHAMPERKVSSADEKRLIALGWFFNDKLGCWDTYA
jgi:hypothetical protein